MNYMDKDTKDINGGVKVGTSNTSIRIGNQFIAGKEFDWSKLYDALTYLPPTDTIYDTRMLIIANLSSHDISLYRSGQLTTVKGGTIDWYNNGVGSNIDFDIQNESDVIIRYLEIYKYRLDGKKDEPLVVIENICHPGRAIRTFIAGNFSVLDYIVFIFDHNM